jgi:hypothetical protein
MIEVYIISSPDRSIEKLCKTLDQIEELKVHIVPGVFLKSQSILEKNAYDSNRAKLLNGRNLTLGEIGCAMAHNECRRMAYSSSNLSIVLEDDVGISNIPLLKQFLNQAVNSINKHDNIVINLAREGKRKRNLLSLLYKGYKWRGTIGATPLAAAYLLTPKSAGILLKKNTPIANVADWPPTNIKFKKSRVALFIHQENKTFSLISEKKGNDRRGFSRIKLISIYLGIYYLTRRNLFKGIEDFYFNLWLPRIKSMISYRTKL